jgi:hypothetical protein
MGGLLTMKDYRAIIREAAAKKVSASLKGYKVIDLQNGDAVLGIVAVDGAHPDVVEVKTPSGLKELDLSKYNHQIDSDLKIIELNERYAN